ncbi:G2/M phase-specific E3 ubiquitin-protein ligase-like [Oopsacas minuta]|uniref:G2/M phase-specific E3 ubiquitin-protein ligase-like n=1 Tax=Oopsacas minuta TaxID=111878 RepID=A0AAV7K6A3_9METZ|nr:G2/M phase-specific E3 ubiquitin-protein ligase-like [Oopsacas minuta]
MTMYSLRHKPSSAKKPAKSPKHPPVCVFCNKCDNMEGQLGTLISSKVSSLSAHEYCLTFSAGLFNQEDEDVGINGFHESGIREELKRGNRLCCKYCGKKGATLGCEDKRCKNAYHLPCALRSNCLLQYFGAFQVFCQFHHIKQVIHDKKSTSFHEEAIRSLTSEEENDIKQSLITIPFNFFIPESAYTSLIPSLPYTKRRASVLPTQPDDQICTCTLHPVKGRTLDLSPDSLLYYFSEPDPTHQSTISCGICICDIDNKPSFHNLVTPCCGNYFHRPCLQRMALSAGKHHFKCPMCGNVEDFQNEMQTFGINLPDRDALWEDGDAYHDLHSIFEECCASDCLCPHGRQFALDDSVLEKEDPSWAIFICSSCGQFGLHYKCCRKEYPHLICELDSEIWNCPTCSVALDMARIEDTKLNLNVKLKDFSIHLVKI